jgi:hypothetical protein
MIGTCRQCKFWTPTMAEPDPRKVFGQCQRKPPSVFLVKANQHISRAFAFPETPGNCWCGEFAPKLGAE